MLTRIRKACRRLHIAWLRYRISEAEKDACVLEAECLTMPLRLIKTRSYINDLQAYADELEAQA